MTAAGHADDGEPRAAPRYTPDFVRDPNGNNVEVVNHNR
jgi:hypothetical protein